MALARPRIAVPALIDPTALAGCDARAQVMDLGGETMGTYWRVRVAVEPARDVAALRAAIEARLATIVAEMSHWSPESLLTRFSTSAAVTWIDLPVDFRSVIATGLAIAERSGGAFDPAIGRLTDLYGLGPNPAAMVPDDLAIEAASAVSGWHRLAFDASTGRLRQPGGLWLDLSGIAKGHAVDAVADLTSEMGFRHALVEIGGECAGRGMRPDGDPWWVELETPPGVALPPLRIALHQLAVATSGNYVRGDHSLDPRTGRPAHNGVTSVSVLHKSAKEADAWATALTILGPQEGVACARREKLAVRMIWILDGIVTEWLSPELEAML